jgi:hypothetical protein
VIERLRRLSIPREIAFAALSVLAALPVWLVEHPPIQDLPQHLAAIRVLADFGDPELGFERWFETSLGSTQYLAYYLAAIVLSKVFGVVAANRILITAAIVGTPYAMRALLRALGRNEDAALLVFPLTWNAHLILGFLNFASAIPLALYGLALAVQLRREPTRARAVGLAAVALVAFLTHVVPFAFFAVGAALVAAGDDLRSTLRRLLPLVPAALAAVIWSQASPAGQSTLTAAFFSDADGAGPQPQFMSWADAIRETPAWLTDVLHTETDEHMLVLWALLVFTMIALGAGPSTRDHAASRDDVLTGSLLRRLGLLAPLAALAYFVTPASYDWIWPINARFPLLALLFLVPLVPVPRGLARLLVLAGVVAVSVTSALEVTDAFERFEEEEVGELDDALEEIPAGQKVAGLIFDRGSGAVKFSPFIHSVAWYQAEKGGAVMFTFADFPHSPFRFRQDDRPPRVQPRWEWMPERVDPRADLGWYDYVLVRGGPGRIASQRETFEPIHRGPRWSVWRRVGER